MITKEISLTMSKHSLNITNVILDLSSLSINKSVL